MLMTATAATYRKTKQGEWVAFAPVSAFYCDEARTTPRREVLVAKKDGTTKMEPILRLGRTFQVDGVGHCYAYLDRRPAVRRAAYYPSTDHEDCLSYIGGCGLACPHRHR